MGRPSLHVRAPESRTTKPLADDAGIAFSFQLFGSLAITTVSDKLHACFPAPTRTPACLSSLLYSHRISYHIEVSHLNCVVHRPSSICDVHSTTRQQLVQHYMYMYCCTKHGDIFQWTTTCGVTSAGQRKRHRHVHLPPSTYAYAGLGLTRRVVRKMAFRPPHLYPFPVQGVVVAIFYATAEVLQPALANGTADHCPVAARCLGRGGAYSRQNNDESDGSVFYSSTFRLSSRVAWTPFQRLLVRTDAATS